MRRNRKTFYEEKETRKIFLFSFSVLIIAILSFVITYFVYSNTINEQLEIAQAEKNSITNLRNSNTEILSQASSTIGKTINEVENENKEQINKIAINTSNMVKENEDTEKQETEIINENKEIDSIENEKVPDPRFIKPVDGEITVEYAKDNLVYSNTLGEWVTHKGIDIQAAKTSVVKASADGTIKSIKNDPRYGLTVVVEHVNGFESIYANLLSTEFIKEGEEIKQGQGIGTVGNTAAFEIADEPHLHFELLKDGENLDPEIYI